MSTARRYLSDWFERGAVLPAHAGESLRASGVYPPHQAWGRFVDRLLLFVGVAMLLSGVTTFFAANWDTIGRLGRFALVDLLILLTLAVTWFKGLDSLVGRAALLASAVLVGVLLAVVGQEYQTGADVYELFAAWAVLILPWVLLGRFQPLWLLWFGLVNLSIYLYYDTFDGLFGWAFGSREMQWVFLGLNSAALFGWEVAAAHAGSWLQGRAAPRILAVAAGTPVTLLAVQAVFESTSQSRFLDFLLWFVWFAAVFGFYRYRRVDVFVLAGLLLSLVIVVVAGLMRALLGNGGEAMGLFTIALVVLGISSAGGWWLTRLANRKPSA